MDEITTALVELVGSADYQQLILVGRLAINLKRQDLVQSGQQTLIPDPPLERATGDLDLFLRLELFTNPAAGQVVRRAIDSLGYKVRQEKWQFESNLPTSRTPYSLDLLACPSPKSQVKSDNLRVGIGSGADLHGRTTIEGFAVETSPNTLVLSGGVNVTVASSYALLNMKLRASYDWLRYTNNARNWPTNQKPPSPKHLFDALCLVCMLTEGEMDKCKGFATHFQDLEVAQAIRNEASELFGQPNLVGWTAAVGQGIPDEHDLIYSTLQQCLGE
ncbi:MAG: hypothetical protein JST12_15030 [Armatimonadetes bacterium]|nr:hypothetical protein [Armatimonadota bacterium]